MAMNDTDREPDCAMFARDGMGAPCWYYPGDLQEARQIAHDHFALPYWGWPEEGGPGPKFPWTKAEVTAR